MIMRKFIQNISIRTMLLIPMLVVNLLIVAIFLSAISFSDLNYRMKDAEVSTIKRALQIKGETTSEHFGRLSTVAEELSRAVEQVVAEEVETEYGVSNKLKGMMPQLDDVLAAGQGPLIDALKQNEATGAFIILLPHDTQSGKEVDINKAEALYIKDMDISSSSDDNMDLMLYYGSKQISRNLGIPLDNRWKVDITLDAFSDSGFVTLPYQAALDSPDKSTDLLGCWVGPVIREDGKKVIYYTLPVRGEDKIPYGVVGVELALDIVDSRLYPTDMRFPDSSFCAIAAHSNSVLSNKWVTTAGIYAKSNITGREFELSRLPEYGSGIVELVFNHAVTTTVATYPLDIVYIDTESGESMEWIMLAGTDNQVLFGDANRLNQFFTAAFLLALIVGVLFSLVSSRYFVNPIIRLSRRLETLDAEDEIRLKRTNIAEIDVLIDSIEGLSEDLIASARRTIQTIEMTDMQMGFIEINAPKQRVYLTDYIFDLFSLDKINGSNYYPLAKWKPIQTRLEDNIEPEMDNVYRLDFIAHKPYRWLRFRLASDGARTFAVIIDVTGEVLEKRRLELERDTDPLTGLLNRQAFFKKAGDVLKKKPDCYGMMLFADIDNLKYVNDTYGHDYGDRYIRAAATVFSRFSSRGGIVSRLSGDEFAIYVHGYHNKEELASIMSETYSAMDKAHIDLPDGNEMRVRCSVGFSWYPDDSSELDVLTRYADFAMYETKRSIKGSVREFSIDSYLKNSYLVEKNEEFNLFIEQNQVRYAFQPIVDIFSGGIFAYEALMRPTTPAFASPYHVLQIARSQAKLYQIERMTIFNVMEWIDENIDALGDTYVFINSIPNQTLSDKHIEEIQSKYRHIFHQVVIEITEDEHSDEEFLEDKMKKMRNMGNGIAIDDFGAGYSNEVMVLRYDPEYIKIDISLVQGIHNSTNKRQMVSSIINYARQQDIKIIAEGIECVEEAEEMIKLGADYLQGYYFGKPEFELAEIDTEVSANIKQFARKYRDRRNDNR